MASTRLPVRASTVDSYLNEFTTRFKYALLLWSRVGIATWQHDSVLRVFVHGLQTHLPDCFKLYADLPGYIASVSPPSTIPTKLSTTLSRPDLVSVSF